MLGKPIDRQRNLAKLIKAQRLRFRLEFFSHALIQVGRDLFKAPYKHEDLKGKRGDAKLGGGVLNCGSNLWWASAHITAILDRYLTGTFLSELQGVLLIT